MVPLSAALAGPGRFRLGAEELLELGQAAVPSMAAPAGGAAARTVALSKEEAGLLVHVVENLVSFAQSYPVEFQSYCPPDRWQKALTQVGTWSHEIERQMTAGAQQVTVPAEAVFRLVDLEKCVSAARDARLSSAKWAFGLAAVGSIANFVFGLSWIGVPTYIAGLAILFGRPLMAKYYPEPQDPYKPAISGPGELWNLSGCTAPRESDEEKAKPKLLERVILPARSGRQKFHWGDVDCAPGGQESAMCLRKDRLRVRVEGWTGDRIRPAEGWERTDGRDCREAFNVIGVWDAAAGPRRTPHGPLPEKSRHEDTYWIEYVGPMTGGAVRRAGPFACPFGTMDHGMMDGGIKKRGADGEFVLFDAEDRVVDMEPETKAA